MSLDLWAQLNLIGHVSYQDYLEMTHEEAVAALEALQRAIEQVASQKKSQVEAQNGFDALCDKYANMGRQAQSDPFGGMSF